MILDPKNLLNIFFFEIKVKIMIAPARFEFVTNRFIVNVLTHCATLLHKKLWERKQL